LSFSIYFYNKFFWEQENLGGTKEILGRTAPECPPVAMDLPLIINNKSFGTRNYEEKREILRSSWLTPALKSTLGTLFLKLALP